MPIRLALAEDHPALRDRVSQQLAFFDDLDLMLVAESGDALLADLDVRARGGAPMPEVVLMDIEMPGRDGIATTAALRARYPDVEVLMLTVFEAEDKIFAAVQAGASGYLLKDSRAEDIARAVAEVAEGGAPTSPLVARHLLRYVRAQQAAARASAEAADAFAGQLTPREAEVLQHLVEDRPEPEIARALGVSPHTVRSHVKNLYAKLEVHSRAQAVRLALARGLA